ncbi:bifunctional diaminohydroxyphosphoribosylaminopyrimidine deaminase/5-amino-6-(5-phosphoribosylamino)uracil reductase RibD [Consotaella salsifontis]|uniref:Riboflavin biosynthesis protein RibD n=1 Tax=Consotaella salsifontis TaxID=1365950 RepID=A0A1T4P3W1_9HYPH|nr:bifunctional diaminohydroxyphosphoribosylaminopyrimidine deaminase/5-amino-6-(5-phosphoribosylamino)uracil reductase RibD [Consotaella salsifontis]SJZ86203.1 diaminohydroxyphosphoribosylaminopyrimidine deaminase [Consotaella salsifontis]
MTFSFETAGFDRRMMAAAIRLSQRHAGRTGTNPSVATLLVREEHGEPVIVGRGITALGGRPHAETMALAEAGERARGATAYVTLEPCAHHGRTPPCAEALVEAGVARVVTAAADPDPRVSGRGHAILVAGGIAVDAGVLAAEAERAMAGYLSRQTRRRPLVTLKMAVSADGFIGRLGAGQIPITGPIANAQTHLRRARADAILVGVGTVIEDDPQLTCRLPGLFDRSPVRIVLDPRLKIPETAAVVRTAAAVPTMLAVLGEIDPSRHEALRRAGCTILACEADPESGRIALPELLEDLAARGLSTVLVEGGAMTAKSFLNQDLVDRLVLHLGQVALAEGVPAPIMPDAAARRYRLVRRARYGSDEMIEFERRGPECSVES